MYYVFNCGQFLPRCIAFCQYPQSRQNPFPTTIYLGQLYDKPVGVYFKFTKQGCRSNLENYWLSGEEITLNLLVRKFEDFSKCVAFEKYLLWLIHIASSLSSYHPLDYS